MASAKHSVCSVLRTKLDSLLTEEYVADVQSVDPNAFGEGLLVVDSGRVVIQALQQALVTAGLIIILILAVLWRNFLDATLVVAPLVFPF